jgi:hypothetical protein
MMTALNEPHRAIAARGEVGCEGEKDVVRVLVPLIDQGRKVAL